VYQWRASQLMTFDSFCWGRMTISNGADLAMHGGRGTWWWCKIVLTNALFTEQKYAPP
jgi:hypothetical protein